MGQPLTQQSFAGGEAAPEFRGSTRNPRHAISLRTCKNFLPISNGALVNRPGTFDLGGSKTARPRWEAFIFSDTQALLLEFTDLAVRFWTSDGQVLSAGVPYEVVTPYVAADLARLNFFQAGDVVTIEHPNYQPRDLTRISNTSWTLAVVSTTPRAYFGSTPDLSNPIPAGNIDPPDQWNPATVYAKGAVTNFLHVGYISLQAGNTNKEPDQQPAWWSPQSWDSTIVYKQGDMVWHTAGYDGTAATLPAAANAQLYISLQHSNKGQRPDTAATYWAAAVDASHPAQDWTLLITQAWADEFGVVRETLPLTFIDTIRLPAFSDRAISWGWDPDGLTAFPHIVKDYNFYAGRNGVFGFIGSADGAGGNGGTFTWDGSAPDFGQQPPKGTDPFEIAPAGDSWPGCGTYHDQRRVFARSDAKPDTFMGSKVGDIANFDKNDPVQDSDAYEWRVSSGKLQEIRNAVSFGRLVLFASGGIFSAHGADGTGITPNAVEVRRDVKRGASYLAPLEVGELLLWNTSKGNHVFDLFFDLQTEGYRSRKLSKWANHLFKDHTIVSWAYQEDPYGIVWAARSDGALLSMTFDPEESVFACARHPTRGRVTQVACIPNGTEDALLLAVERNGSSRVEKMASRNIPQIADGVDEETGLDAFRDDVRFCCFLDSSLQFDGRNTSAVTMKVTGASYVAEALVAIEASAASFAATDIGDRVVIDPNGTPTSITVTAFTDATHITGRLEAALPADFQNVARALWGWGRDTLSGLDHLDGMAVTVLADGVVQGPFTVAGGQIGPLAPPALIATVGLSYNSDAELLDVAADAVKTNVKSVSRVTFDVVASRGIYAGEDFDNLRPAKTRLVSDNFGAPRLITDQVEVLTKSSWNTGGRAVVRQVDPLPLTITAMTRDVIVGGRGD